METLTQREAVAAEVRAELARKQITASTVAEAIQMPTSTLSRRLKADTPFTVDELAAIARVLGTTPGAFFYPSRSPRHEEMQAAA